MCGFGFGYVSCSTLKIGGGGSCCRFTSGVCQVCQVSKSRRVRFPRLVPGCPRSVIQKRNKVDRHPILVCVILYNTWNDNYSDDTFTQGHRFVVLYIHWPSTDRLYYLGKYPVATLGVPRYAPWIYNVRPSKNKNQPHRLPKSTQYLDGA